MLCKACLRRQCLDLWEGKKSTSKNLDAIFKNYVALVLAFIKCLVQDFYLKRLTATLWGVGVVLCAHSQYILLLLYTFFFLLEWFMFSWHFVLYPCILFMLGSYADAIPISSMYLMIVLMQCSLYIDEVITLIHLCATITVMWFISSSVYVLYFSFLCMLNHYTNISVSYAK